MVQKSVSLSWPTDQRVIWNNVTSKSFFKIVERLLIHLQWLDSLVANFEGHWALISLCKEHILWQDSARLDVANDLVAVNWSVLWARREWVSESHSSELRVPSHQLKLDIRSMEPTVVRSAISIHDIDWVDRLIFLGQIVFKFPISLMEVYHNDHYDQFNNYEKLDVQGRQCTVPASLLDHLGNHFTNHDKGEWNDWNEKA